MGLLDITGVSLGFGGLQVLKSLDLTVGEGEIVAVIGPNGAGKTTLFNLITGVYQPDEGDICFDGRSIVGIDPHRVSNLGVARTFQNLRLFLNMTVKENVLATMYGRNRAGVVSGALGLPRAARRRTGNARRGRTIAGLFWDAIAGLPLRPAGVLVVLRQSTPVGDRPSAGHSPATAARRRTSSRDEPDGDP